MDIGEIQDLFRCTDDGDAARLRGWLRITSKSAPDEYHPYFDIMKLRDGKILEYNIAYDI